MTHKISLADLTTDTDHMEFENLLAVSSSDKKSLYHVLVIDKEYTSQMFRVRWSEFDPKQKDFDGIFPAIREYNSH